MSVCRIHIVGCGPRSGTTLIMELMKNSFDIDLSVAHESRIYKPPPSNGRIFITKQPSDIQLIERFLNIKNNLYVIYMIRDPRDMIVSKHQVDMSVYWSSLKFWKLNAPIGNKLSHHPRFITIRYEDLVTDPDQVQNEISKQITFLDKTKNFSDFDENTMVSEGASKALGGSRKVSNSSIGNWKNHLERVKQQIRLHGSINEDLIKYGYENNDQWETQLDKIPNKEFKSYWPEYFDENDLKKRRSFTVLKLIFFYLSHIRPLPRIITVAYRVLKRIIHK